MVNAYLGKRSYYHSSSTMHSCKLWHYLCWHKGETWRREKKMKGENKEKKGVAFGETHTQTLACSQWRRLCSASSSQACQIYFQHQGTLCPSPAPSISPLFGVSVWSESWMEAGTYRTISGGVCAFVLRDRGWGGVWNRSCCQGTRARGILHRLASQGAMGAPALGKSPAEVKSAVIEMKGGSPTPPTHQR